MLFGAGGFAAALMLPALIFGIGIAAPHGWFSDYAISHQRMYALAASPGGRLLLMALLPLCFWHAAHHLRHLALDLGLGRLGASVPTTLYGLAFLGTLVSLRLVWAL